jgi:hypothetical protein
MKMRLRKDLEKPRTFKLDITKDVETIPRLDNYVEQRLNLEIRHRFGLDLDDIHLHEDVFYLYEINISEPGKYEIAPREIRGEELFFTIQGNRDFFTSKMEFQKCVRDLVDSGLGTKAAEMIVMHRDVGRD